MQPRQCVGSELGDDDRLVVAAGPQPKFVFKPAPGGDEVAGVDVPTEVTIEENDVEQVRDLVDGGGRHGRVRKGYWTSPVQIPDKLSERREVPVSYTHLRAHETR